MRLQKVLHWNIVAAMFVLIVAALPVVAEDVQLRFDGRKTFLRLEREASLTATIENKSETIQGPFQIELLWEGQRIARRPVAPIAPGARERIAIPVDTRLRTGAYKLEATLFMRGSDPLRAETAVTIAAAPSEDRLEILLWGVTRAENAEAIGFTGLERPRNLDDALALGMFATHRSSTSRSMSQRHRAINREGNMERGELASEPRMQSHAYDRARAVVRSFGDHPAWRYILLHPENRHGNVSFDDLTRRAFREYAGQDIPDEVRQKRGVDYQRLADFPASRIIPENHPIHRFYYWYWKGGDGWADLHNASARAIKENRPDVNTIAAPALRIASIYDSWGDVDVLWHWTYTHPDPTRLAQSTDTLLTMAQGSRPHKQVVSMTQMFNKRSYVMPSGQRDEPMWDGVDAPFTDVDPNADYFTITPDQIRGAFWTKIAYPVDGIGYHGWESISPESPNHQYQFTLRETPEALADVLHNVARPLGPMLRKVGDPPARVGFLNSFASEMFANRGDYGWPFRSWNGDAYLALMHAGLQPKTLFDETIRNGGLDGLDVLVLVHCDVLTERVAEQIKRFQARGGIVVGDQDLAPGIKPDIRWESPGSTRNAQRRKANILEKAAELQKALEGRFEYAMRSDNPEVILRLRQAGNARYLFAVNDHRKAGNYMGQHGWVMEDGLPSTAQLAVRAERGSVVYDLRRARQVPANPTPPGWVQFRQTFGPCDGNVFLILDRPIRGLQLEVPDSVRPMQPVNITARIVDAQGDPIEAVLPVQVELIDAQRRSADIAGYYAAVDGTLSLQWFPAPNDQSGQWQLRVRDLASGQSATARIELAAR